MERYWIVLVLILLGDTVWTAVPVAAARLDAGPSTLAEAGFSYRPHDGGAVRYAEGALTVDLIKQAIRQQLEAEWGQKVTEVQVSVLEPSDPVAIPPGKVEWRVVPSSNGEGLGRRMFQVAVTVKGKPWKRVEVLADVTAMIDAIVLNRYLKSDELIDVADLRTTRVRVSQFPHPFLTDRDEVVGKGAARPIPAGTPLRAAFVKAPTVIKKGDRVTIEAKRGGLAIQTYGVTKSSGHVGQTVMVANLDSGREFRAKVVAPGLVQVEF